MNRNRRTRPAAVLLALAAGLTLAPAAQGSVADEVHELLAEARAEAGAGRLERRPTLDAVAATRAETVAARPHQERLIQDKAIEELLHAAEIKRFHKAAVHQDMQRGFPDPAAAFIRVWQRYESAWETAMTPGFDAVGMATARGDDGWLIITVILLDEQSMPADLGTVERELLAAVNAARAKHRVEPLVYHEPLAEVARAHSEDMARRQYFGHRGPDGVVLADRVRAHGVAYRRVAENLYRSRGMRDPVASAVRGWLDSSGHRENMLNPVYSQTGIGVAFDDEGRLYFTQVFRTP